MCVCEEECEGVRRIGVFIHAAHNGHPLTHMALLPFPIILAAVPSVDFLGFSSIFLRGHPTLKKTNHLHTHDLPFARKISCAFGLDDDKWGRGLTM